MVAIQVEAQVTLDQLLKAVGELSSSDLDEFVQRVLALRARRRAPNLSEAESRLFLKINQGLPDAVWSRSKELIAKRKADTLTADEYEELLRLTDQIEVLHADRMESLAELALLRNCSLRALMDELGILPAPDE